MVNLIVATDRNGLIGNKGTIPWKIPNDMKYFKEKTSGSTVIMGRKTYQSIGKPLPNRINIVISKKKVHHSDFISVSSLDEALLKCPLDRPIFIIGGSEIYKLFLNKKYIDRIYLTEIDGQFEGDTYFKLPDEWKLYSSMRVTADDKNEFAQTYKVYQRY